MNSARQELLLITRRKLEQGNYPPDQRDLTLRMLELFLELAPASEDDSTFAALISNFTRSHNLVSIIQQQISELDALKHISFNLTSSLQMQEVLEAIVTEAMRLIKNAQGVHIFRYQDGILTFGSSLDSDNNRNRLISPPRPEGLTYTVAHSRQTIVVDDMHEHPLFKNAPSSWRGSILGIPLIIGDDVVGVMNLARWRPGGFTRSELRLLELLAGYAALAINNARLHEVVAGQANTDALTALPNRRALDVRLEEEIVRAKRYERPFAVIMFDLDEFKSINDKFGHGTGDMILRQFAQHLASIRRATDFLARYGGDELMMILPETDLEGARQVAQFINERVSSFDVTLPDGSKHALHMSGGIATFPFHAGTASDMLRAADEALYRAKRHARGTFLVAVEGEIHSGDS